MGEAVALTWGGETAGVPWLLCDKRRWSFSAVERLMAAAGYKAGLSLPEIF